MNSRIYPQEIFHQAVRELNFGFMPNTTKTINLIPVHQLFNYENFHLFENDDDDILINAGFIITDIRYTETSITVVFYYKQLIYDLLIIKTKENVLKHHLVFFIPGLDRVWNYCTNYYVLFKLIQALHKDYATRTN